MRLISIIIPCYNEEENVGLLFDRMQKISSRQWTIGETAADVDLTRYNWEFIFVNDGSSDGTKERLAQLHDAHANVKVINLSRNFGKESAMLAGLDFSTGDAAIIIDSDLQHPVETIPEMVYWWEQGYADVYGQRKSRGKESVFRKSFSLMFYSILDKIGDTPTLPNVGDFRLLDRRAVNALTSLRESQRYTKGLYCWIGFNKKGVEYQTLERVRGKSSFNFFKLLNLAIDGITSYTTKPLRIASIIGSLFSAGAFIYMVYIFIKTILYGDPVTGFPTLICIILLLGGLQLLALGIIGEYIGHIYKETKNRPPYVVDTFMCRDDIGINLRKLNEEKKDGETVANL